MPTAGIWLAGKCWLQRVSSAVAHLMGHTGVDCSRRYQDLGRAVPKAMFMDAHDVETLCQLILDRLDVDG